MKATTKKIYSLASAIVLVVLSVLLFVGAMMPMFKVNMANVRTAEAFEEGYFTEGLEIDEAKIGFGGALKLLKYKKYVSIINKYQNNEQTIRNAAKSALEGGSISEAVIERVNKATKENEEILASLTDADYEELEKLFQDKKFINALYLEIGFVSLFSDILTEGDEENYIYETKNVLAVFSMIFGMIFLAGFMVSMTVFTIVAFFSALKKVIALATGFKKINLKKLESFYPEKTLTGLMLPLLFFILAKAMLGSRLVLGSGIIMIFVCFALISVLRAANKIMLKEKRNPKHIARVLVGLLSFIFVLCIFNNVINMNLVENYYRSNDVNVNVAYQAKYDAVYAEELAKAVLSGNSPNLNAIKSSAKHAAQGYVTEILVKNALPLLGITFLVSILTFILLTLSLNRLRENSDDFKSSYSAEKYGPHYVVAILLLGAVLLTSVLGVSTVEERNKAYFDDGGVKILWNDYTLEGSGTKEEYDATVLAYEELTKAIEEAKDSLDEISDEDMKAELEFEIKMAERKANKTALKIETLENSAATRRATATALLIVLIVLEILYQIAPKLTDKLLPEGAKRFLAGPDDEEIDTSLNEDAAPAAAEAAPAAAEAPAAYTAPAEDAPVKEKSFKQDEEPAPAANGEDDLAAQMQKMFDNQ